MVQPKPIQTGVFISGCTGVQPNAVYLRASISAGIRQDTDLAVTGYTGA